MMSTVAFGGSIAKRFVEQAPLDFKLPSYFYWISFVDLLLFLPVWAVLGYTFEHIYPTLAAVEDRLPEYEAVPTNDDDAPKGSTNPTPAAQPGKPVTASLRATNRLLKSHGGWASNFRGFGYAILISILTMICAGFVGAIPVLGAHLGHLAGLVVLSPLSTTLTHVVITPPSAKAFFRRIPPLRKTYTATLLPTIFLWTSTHLSVMMPAALAGAIGLSFGRPGGDGDDDGVRFGDSILTGAEAAKMLCVAALAVALQAAFVVPAHALLARVKASLLPADEETIVPFDRSFGGLVAPEVVDGKGFATLGAALGSMSLASWRRIYLLRVKLFAVSVACHLLFALLVVVQVLIVRQACDKGDGEGGLKCY
ncbi:hypothetical protein VTK26DRAFT_7925 [Humicola hyalothermophila]